MTILSRNDQNGRSMVEMLGVLAIIGVLSVGGISGYSKAMAKFKLTKAQDQVTMLLMNIRTAFAANPSYDGLTTKNARLYNIAPGDMFGVGSDQLNNAFGGEAFVFSCGVSEGTDQNVSKCSAVSSSVKEGATENGVQYFAIALSRLGREACVSLASSDWGTDGLIGMQIHNGTAAQTAHPASELPLNMIKAGGDCGASGSYNTITWVYY